LSTNQAKKDAVRVLVVDDHVLIRKGLCSLLKEIEGVEIVGEAATGEEAIRLTTEIEPDVVLMDIDMPTKDGTPATDGIEATKRIKALLPDVEILAISSCAHGPVPAEILLAGARGYVVKGAARDEIRIALNKVRNHQPYMNAELARRLAVQSTAPEDSTPFDKLSRRELEVATLIAQGKKVADVASALVLSPKTVNSYRYRIFAKFTKFQVDSDIELTHLAMQYGIVEEE
jgi:two-component system, NarL family, invasion response regulator UvrY